MFWGQVSAWGSGSLCLFSVAVTVVASTFQFWALVPGHPWLCIEAIHSYVNLFSDQVPTFIVPFSKLRSPWKTIAVPSMGLPQAILGTR